MPRAKKTNIPKKKIEKPVIIDNEGNEIKAEAYEIGKLMTDKDGNPCKNKCYHSSDAIYYTNSKGNIHIKIKK